MPKDGLAIMLEESSSKEKDPDEKTDAAQDLIDAIKSGDATGVSLALERHYELCSGMGDEDEEEAPSSKPGEEMRY